MLQVGCMMSRKFNLPISCEQNKSENKVGHLTQTFVCSYSKSLKLMCAYQLAKFKAKLVWCVGVVCS